MVWSKIKCKTEKEERGDVNRGNKGGGVRWEGGGGGGGEAGGTEGGEGEGRERSRPLGLPLIISISKCIYVLVI